MSGVLITKGMRMAIPVGGIKIRMDQQEEMQVKVVVHYDVCPKWLELSLEHLLEAQKSKNSRIIAWNENKENKIDFLEEEFAFSMQSIMAASIALDAFYSSIKEYVEIPQSLTELWRERRTSRHAQIGEVLRRAFSLKSNGTKNLRKFLQVIFKFRDLAVHPSGKLEEPILHPELNVGVEWRFVYFSFERAKNILMATLEIMWQLINSKNIINPKINDHCKSLIQLLSPVYEKWKCNYGSLEATKGKVVEIK
ncbi:MAG: hypothetical protein NTZ27_02420 [Ignavibacteriales bacterium]|nr:hypothetical protein [Ignavibacteriales bacterium]